MFGNKKLKIDNFTNLVAEGTTLDGTLNFTGVILIRGHVKGDVVRSADMADDTKADNCISVAVGGIVESAQIIATNIVIDGTVTSNTICATDTISIGKGGIVKDATIYFRNIQIDPGALVHNCQLKHLDHSADQEIV